LAENLGGKRARGWDIGRGQETPISFPIVIDQYAFDEITYLLILLTFRISQITTNLGKAIGRFSTG